MIQSYDRLKVYAAMGFLAFSMLALGAPIGNAGTWFGALVMIGLGLWVEISDFDEDEDDRDQ
ncbi:hypothetical protein ATO46_11330 [Aeromonas schubertii]|uniref:hypothetical protein n=1 Tax=Aeromonas schubertii TaxID=652 RepID=UPI00067EE7D3|nr:hypothetical protein [Aeromonas schubertii]KUE78273.1 hypothetical protein ATO46_11330 [Aeromonas schubertii]